MRSHYIERYLAGEREAVWGELTASGAAVREEPLYSDAMRVCEEIVKRASFNLRLLHRRLTEMGYGFARPESALKEAGDGAEDEIEEVERRIGTMPLIARVWYATWESVDFSPLPEETYSERPEPQSPPGCDFFGIGFAPALTFQSLDQGLTDYEERRTFVANEARSMRSRGDFEAASRYEGEQRPFLNLEGPEHWRWFPLPAFGIDGLEHADLGETTFADELRRIFACGGFPGAVRHAALPEIVRVRNLYRPDLERWLPRLKEGLLAI